MDHLFASPLESKSWRSFLEEMIQTPQERERIAAALGVHSLTLSRWTKQKATPHPKHLPRLLEIFPEHSASLYQLIRKEFPTFSAMVPMRQAISEGVPKVFYREVLERLSQESQSDYWALRNDILLHALHTLNTPQSDIMVMLAFCTTPAQGQPVRSLRGTMCVGFPPEGASLDQKPFLGAESLVGRVVQTNTPVFIPDTQKATKMQPPRRNQHRSIAIYPLRRGNAIAGTFTVASCTPYAFLEADPSMEEYALLLALTCPERGFYPPEEIALQIMPPFPMQDPYLFSYPQRLVRLTQQTRNWQPSLSLIEREQMVLRQIEEELLQVAHPAQTEHNNVKATQPAISS